MHVTEGTWLRRGLAVVFVDSHARVGAVSGTVVRELNVLRLLVAALEQARS